MKWITESKKNSHICNTRRNNVKFPYHRYLKEITPTLSLISSQTLITLECLINETTSNNVHEMSQKVKDIDIKQSIPTLGVESLS